MRRSRSVFPVLAALLAVTGEAQAQAIRVQVREARAAGGGPLAGAIVALETPDARRLVPTLSDSLGQATLVAPEPGRYVVRVDFVGRATWRSDTLELAAGAMLQRTAELEATLPVLARVQVRERAVCDRRRERDPDVATTWEEARKVLLASTLLRDGALPLMRVRRFDRLLDEHGRVLHEEADSLVAASTRPFTTVGTPQELSARGYVVDHGNGVAFLAPDAVALMSDVFVRDHCFSLVERRGAPGLLGLAFRPHEDRDVPEVAGTLWLDRATSALRSLEFRYVGAGVHADRARAGGRMEFAHVEGAGWIVSSWMVRTPRIAEVVSQDRRGRPVTRDTLLGAREEGSSVTVIGRVGAAVADAAAPGAPGARRVRGRVYDSTRGAPLAGVHVSIPGGADSATTGDDGRFDLAAPHDGALTLALSHTRLRQFRVPPYLEIGSEAAPEVDVAIPALPRARARLCPENDADGPRVPVIGVVHDADGRPVPFAAVRGGWIEPHARTAGRAVVTEQRTVVTDANADEEGVFALCGLPVRTRLQLVAMAPGFVVHDARLELRAGEIGEWNPTLRACGPADAPPRCHR